MLNQAYNSTFLSSSLSLTLLLLLLCLWRLSTPPETLDQLSDSLNLLERLKADTSSIESQFGPLSDQFNLLQKYEVQVWPEV